MDTAAARGIRNVSLDDKYTLDAARAYMTGIEALVRLPMLQHQRDRQRGLNTAAFISGYRGSPLGGVDQAFWRARRWLEPHNVVHFSPASTKSSQPPPSGAASRPISSPARATTACLPCGTARGRASIAAWTCSNMRMRSAPRSYGGVLAVAGDDHACKSSTLPHQSEHDFIAASIPVLSPANVQEVLDLGIYGWELSRYCGCWVALKAITENMDSAISAHIDPARIQIRDPRGLRACRRTASTRAGPIGPWSRKSASTSTRSTPRGSSPASTGLNRVVLDSPNARLGIITSGKAYLDVMQALEDMGITPGVAAEIGLRVYKVGMPWPLEPQVTHDFAEGLEEILVVEEKRSVIEDQLTGQLYNNPVASRPRVVGEFDEQGRDLLPNLGELTPAIVALAIAAPGSGASFVPRPWSSGFAGSKRRRSPSPVRRSSRSGCRTSAPAVRTTPRRASPRAVTRWVASAVTTWPPGWRTGPR
jgi:indolepyruvate ferredoxin oxidoreductase